MAGRKKRQDGIAIIGLAVRFPGAGNYRQFWDNLREGKVFITDIPADRWDWKQYGRIEGKINNRFVNHWGGFLDDVSSFDYRFFSVSKREADHMDPQQRLLLEESWACLEDAGLCPSHLAGHKIGVFVAGYNTDFRDLLERNQEPVNPHHLTGGGSFSLANRLSFFYDFRGPSVEIDTACSGGLAAIKYGVDAILSGECEMSLVGAGNVMLAPDNYVRLTTMHMISPTGKVHTFDQDADGYVRGEGFGVVLLKSLDRALEDGDHIHGVIRGISVNHCGHTPTFTYPSAEEQANVIETAIRQADVRVDQIQYLELHGTGTPKGDPIEFSGITQAFGALAKEQKVSEKAIHCGLGSVKTNIGHLENAAGLASLAKVLLSMEHGEIPAMLNFRQLNPLIPMEGTPFRLITEREKWDESKAKLAGISSWGLGGTNVHMVLEAFDEPVRAPENDGAWRLFVLSARTEDALTQRATDLREYLESHPVALADLSHTLMLGREIMPCRMAFVANSMEDVLACLSDLDNGIPAREMPPEALPAPAMETEEDRQSEAYRQRLETLGAAFAAGADIRFSGIDMKDGKSVPLPAYAFARTACRLPEPGPVNGVQPLEAEAQPGGELFYYQEEWTAREAAGEDEAAGPVILLLPEELGDYSAQAEKKDMLILEAAAEYREKSDRHILIRPDRQEDYEAALEKMIRENAQIAGVVNLLPVSEKYRKDAYLPAVLLKACARLSLRPIRILSAVTFDGPEERAFADGLIGYERTLSVVLRDARMRFLLLRQGDMSPEEMISLAVKESLSGEKDSVLYENGVRKKCAVREIALPEGGPSAIREKGVYLLTGGCGGLGKKFAAYLLKKAGASLILTGRSAPERRQGDIEELKKNGGTVRYMQADAASACDLRGVLKEIKKAFGRLDGVLCMAGIEEEESILQRGREAFEKTLAVKTGGALALDQALAAEGMKPGFILYFSSSSAVLGDFGSCDYAIANRFLMAYAAASRGETRKTAICWPLWKDGGITMQNPDAERLYLAASGQEYMTEEAGTRALERVLSSGAAQALVMTGKKERIDRILNVGPTSAAPEREKMAKRLPRPRLRKPRRTRFRWTGAF